MGWVVIGQDSQVLAVHAALLHTGQILYFSGDEYNPLNVPADPENVPPNLPLGIDHTRLFDGATFAVINPGSPRTDVFCSGHAFLQDGRLLVAGGTEQFLNNETALHRMHFPGLRFAWVFDPVAGGWDEVSSM